MPMTLITGGTGFIGSALVRRFVGEGRKIRVVDNDLRGSRARLNDVADKMEFVNADVRDVTAMTEAAQGIDTLVHLAALNGTENFYNRPELVLDVGIRGMYGALDAAAAAGVRNFILASSSEAYQTPTMVPTPEDVPLMIPDPWNSRYSYGGSKLISEIMLANYHRAAFDRAVIFRPHNVYGPDMGWEHVLPQLILRADAAIRATPTGVVPFEIQGDGSQTRSFVHIEDFLDGLTTIIDRGADRTVYHIGTDEELSIGAVVDTIFDYFGRKAAIVPTPLPLGSTMRRCPDISRLAALGYTPSRRLKDGLPSVADWYVANAACQPAS